jgi:ABC-type multidrug transport system fused ATPase/permease subunit
VIDRHAVFRNLRELLSSFPSQRGKLIASQVLLLVSATSQLGIGFLTERIINEGMAKENLDVAVTTGIWMMVLAVLAGISMAGTA